jgi:hypothetical protein
MAADHGNTPAAWTAVIIIMLGFLAGGVAIVIGEPLWAAGSGAIVVLGGIVGKVMQMMGLGKQGYAEGGAD